MVAHDAETNSLEREPEAAPLATVPVPGAERRHRIVIVGGGAGGLVLATRLGRRLRRRNAEVRLIDANLTHMWKPLLHEVAAGTLKSHNDFVLYISHAKHHHFTFSHGRMDGLDRARRLVWLAPVRDAEGGEAIPRRAVPYDTLVIAVGSVCNDFGVPGAARYSLLLDTTEQAEQVQQRLLMACLKAQSQARSDGQAGLTIAIVGAGATGVELAAELHRATRALVAYGFDRLQPERDVRITLIEAAPRVLPALPRRLSDATARELGRLGITVLCGEQVTEVTAEGVATASGRFVEAGIKVWSAGVKAPDFLDGLDGLETNRAHQLVVGPTLASTRDENIFAIGDCAEAIWPGHRASVPPRAQAAYQEAVTLARTLERRLKGQPALPFTYKDYGSLIALSRSSVGNLMGNLLGSVMIEGWLARMTYLSLYKKHQLALHGMVWVVLSTLINLLRLRTEPRLKLH